MGDSGSASPIASFPLPPTPLAIFADVYATPVLADLDADGDADLVAGDASLGFRFYENVGDEMSASYVLRTGV